MKSTSSEVNLRDKLARHLSFMMNEMGKYWFCIIHQKKKKDWNDSWGYNQLKVHETPSSFTPF